MNKEQELKNILIDNNDKKRLGELLAKAIHPKLQFWFDGNMLNFWNNSYVENELTKMLPLSQNGYISIITAISTLNNEYNLISQERFEELKQIFKPKKRFNRKDSKKAKPKPKPLFTEKIEIDHSIDGMVFGDPKEDPELHKLKATFNIHKNLEDGWEKSFDLSYILKVLNLREFENSHYMNSLIRTLFKVRKNGDIFFMYKPDQAHRNDVGILNFGKTQNEKFYSNHKNKDFPERGFFANIFGINSHTANDQRTADDIYYMVQRSVNSNAKSKYLRVKSPFAGYKTPMFYLSDLLSPDFKNPENIEKIFIVEGIKDLLTTFYQLKESGVKNFIVALALGIGEFPKMVKHFGDTFENANIYLIQDDDKAGFSGVISVKKRNMEFLNRLYYIDWKEAVQSENRLEKGDISDYYSNLDYILKLSHFKPVFQATLDELDIKPLRINNSYQNDNFHILDNYNNRRYLLELINDYPDFRDKIIREHKDFIISSPVGSGKSEFIKWLIKRRVFELLIVVSPLKDLKDGYIRAGAESLNSFLDRDFKYQKERSACSITIQNLGNQSEYREFKNSVEFREKILEAISLGIKPTFVIDEAHIHNDLTVELKTIFQLKKEFPALIKIIYVTATAEILFEREKYNSEVVKVVTNLPKLSFNSLNHITVQNPLQVLLEKFDFYGKRTIILNNHIIKNAVMKEHFENFGHKVLILNSTTKKSIKHINFQNYDIIIATSVLEYGVNIFNSGIKNIIGINLEAHKLIQFAGRVRDQSDADVFNIKTYSSGVSDIDLDASILPFSIIIGKKKENVDLDDAGAFIKFGKKIFIKGNPSDYVKDEKIDIRKVKYRISKEVGFLPRITNFSINKKGQIVCYNNPKYSNTYIEKREFKGDTTKFDNFEKAKYIEDKMSKNTSPYEIDSKFRENIYVNQSSFIYPDDEQREALRLLPKKLSELIRDKKDESVKLSIDIYNHNFNEARNPNSQAFTNRVLNHTQNNFPKKLPIAGNSVKVFQSLHNANSENIIKFDDKKFIKNRTHIGANVLETYKNIALAKAVKNLENEFGEELLHSAIKRIYSDYTFIKREKSFDTLSLILMFELKEYDDFFDKNAKETRIFEFTSGERRAMQNRAKIYKNFHNGQFEKLNLIEYDETIQFVDEENIHIIKELISKILYIQRERTKKKIS